MKIDPGSSAWKMTCTTYRGAFASTAWMAVMLATMRARSSAVAARAVEMA